MRILMIVMPESNGTASAASAVGLEYAVGPYYTFRGAGAEVVLASPMGGSPSILFSDEKTALAERFKRDRAAGDDFSNTLRLDQIHSDDFDAAFCVGCFGAIWRPEERRESESGLLLSQLLAAGKPVAVIPSGIDLECDGADQGLIPTLRNCDS